MDISGCLRQTDAKMYRSLSFSAFFDDEMLVHSALDKSKSALCRISMPIKWLVDRFDCIAGTSIRIFIENEVIVEFVCWVHSTLSHPTDGWNDDSELRKCSVFFLTQPKELSQHSIYSCTDTRTNDFTTKMIYI